MVVVVVVVTKLEELEPEVVVVVVTELDELEPVVVVVVVELTIIDELYTVIEHPYELQAVTEYSYEPGDKLVSE